MPIRPTLLKLQEMSKELEATENRRQKVLTFMKQSPLICFMKDAETGRYQFMSEAGCVAIGKTEVEIIGCTDWELFPANLARALISHDLKVLKERQPIVVIEVISYREDNIGLYLVSKFLVSNGEESIGGLAFEIPDTFKMESIRGEQ